MESARIFRKRLQRLGIVFTFLFRIVVCIFPIIEFITQEEVLRSIQKAQIISLESKLFTGFIGDIRLQLKIGEILSYFCKNLIIRKAFTICLSRTNRLGGNDTVYKRGIKRVAVVSDFSAADTISNGGGRIIAIGRIDICCNIKTEASKR